MSSVAPLGYGALSDARGWNGETGTVPVQGPVEEQCTECGASRREHRGRVYGRCLSFKAPITQPRDSEIVQAHVETSWNCHACGEYNDVWGESAIFSWMECSSCGASSFLMM